MQYRADIDGLRAIAVLAVVIFHLDVSGFAGGFVGVDIFFVISGFLITSIIVTQREQGQFRFGAFYARRIRRLLPPLIATVVFSLVIASLLFTPHMMIGFARSAAAALFSLSNIVFFFESGYWDSASELKPLLGLRKHIPLWVSLALITVAGAMLCVWYSSINPSAAFYLLPFRVFQFSLGACLIPLCAALQQSGHRHRPLGALAFWIGLSGIVISVMSFDEHTLFPGWAVLLPTVSGALLLLAGALPAHRPAQWLLENPVSRWLGRTSYSMYLAHWPIIVFYRYHFDLHLDVFDQCVLAVATLLGTCVLHYGIERRFYRRHQAQETGAGLSYGRFSLATLALMSALALTAATAWLGDGWGWRYPEISLSAEAIDAGKQRRFDTAKTICHIARLDAPRCQLEKDTQVLVIGNSLEVDGLNFFDAAYGDDPELHLMQFGSTNGCKRLRIEDGRYRSSSPPCQQRLDTLLDDTFINNIDIVLYAANKPFDHNKRWFLSLFNTLKQRNDRIQLVTFGGYINTERDCAHYINETGSAAACGAAANVSYFADRFKAQPLYTEFAAMQDYYIDRIALLCKNAVLETCQTSTPEGVAMGYDRRHHSLEFSRMSGERYREAFPHLLRDLLSPK